MEVTGLSDYTVESYLGSEFLQAEKEHLTLIAKKPKIPASERVEAQLGKDVTERFRKQVLEEKKRKNGLTVWLKSTKNKD